MPVIKFGDEGTEVAEIQQLLAAQGFSPGPIDGEFGEATERAVVEFQASHIDSKGRYLEVDGKVGPATMWALENPSGASQRNFLDPLIPKGLTPTRKSVVEVAVREYRQNIREIPNGANKGDGVDKYLAGWPAAWCCYFCSYLYHEATGKWPFGKKEGSTYNAWKYSEKHGIYFPKDDYTPIPGDFMLMQYQKNGNWTRTGHISMVLSRTDNRSDGFNTIGGNEGNRCKLGLRHYSQGSLIGFINPYPNNEQPTDFEKGLATKKSVSGDSTR